MMKPRTRLATLVTLLATAPFAFAQTASQSSGNWSTGSIWSTGTAPTTTNVTISAGTTVTADTSFSATSGNLSIFGTLNIGTGTAITTSGDINNNLGAGVTSSGILNINGGSLSVRLIGSSGVSTTTDTSNNFTINLSAGSLTTTNTSAIGYATTINVSGGVFNSAAGGSNVNNVVLNLSNNGKVVFTTGIVGAFGNFSSFTWNGGTLVTNSSTGLGASATTKLFNGLKNNATNVLVLSSQTTKQTLALGVGTVAASGTQGTIAFNVYSSSANDNDLISSTGANFGLSSNVKLKIEGLSLTGSAADYLGKTYQLFNLTGTGGYTGLDASISSTVWNIGGSDYDVTFTNNLATDGTLTVAGLTLSQIPEPSTVAILAGIGALGFAALRRRR